MKWYDLYTTINKQLVWAGRLPHNLAKLWLSRQQEGVICPAKTN